MKKIIILSLLLLILHLKSNAQEIAPQTKKEINKKVFLKQKNTISFSPFNLALSQGVLSYERKIGNKNSIVFQNAFNMFENNKNISLRYHKHFKIQTEVQYRRYLVYTQLRKIKYPDTKNTFGVYLAPLVNYEYGEQHYQSTEEDYDTNTFFEYSEDKFYNAIQAGALAGIKFDIIYGKLSLQLNLGGAYKQSWVVHNKTHENVETYYAMKPGIMAYAYMGFVPKLNFQIGYNF